VFFILVLDRKKLTTCIRVSITINYYLAARSVLQQSLLAVLSKNDIMSAPDFRMKCVT
jgi:hypothetical protein